MFDEWSGAVVDPGSERPAPDAWEPVSVPGRPDAFAGADAVAYRTTFPDPREPDDARALLELEGLYAHARVWLNDELVADHDAYFRPLRIDFEPEERNDLVVVCRRPDDRFGGLHDTTHLPAEERVPGIWWAATVSGQPEAYVADVRATPRYDDEKGAIDVEVDVVAGRAIDDRLTLSLRPEGDLQQRGSMERVPVTADAGDRATVESTIEIRDPALWWPRDLGPQHRYTVRAKLDDASETVTTGLCTMEYGGNGLSVNGRRLHVRGVSLLSATEEDVERAAERNVNLVRARAHAPPQSVYDAADREGVLVWQDVPLTGSGSFDVDRGRELATALGTTYRHHPSLAAFGVHDQPVGVFDDRLGSGPLDRLRFRYRAWRTSYDRGPATQVAEALPDGYPTFPVVGAPGTSPDAATLYPGWDYGEPDDVEWLLDTYPSLGDVVAGVGAGAVGPDAPESVAGFDADKHEVHAALDDPESSQKYQARVVRTTVETLRRRDSHAVVVDALRDAADAGMGVLCRDGTPKRAADALAAAYEPVQAMLATPTASESPVVVVNDTAEEVSGTLSWRADGDGDVDFAVAAHARSTVETVSLPQNGTVELRVSLPDRTVTNEYDV